MTSLRTLTEIDRRHNLLPDIDERLWLERDALARSRYLHGLTQSVLTKTIDDYRLSPDVTAVIGRGLRDRARATTPESGNDRARRVLFVGRIERRKGVDTLLAAARELIDEGVPIEFTIAGPDADPSIRESFEREAVDRPQLRAAVRFTGAVSDGERDRLYREADMVCVPSRYESHGVVLVEAMMFGKPVVTCDAGGIGEVVQVGRNALVSRPDDPGALAGSLRGLASAPALRAKLGARAREAYEQRFEAGTVARQIESFLMGVINAHARSTSDVNGRLERLVRDWPGIAPGDARALAGELLDPPAAAWRALAQERNCKQAEDALRSSNTEIARLTQTLASQTEAMAFLHARHETLGRVEQGGWWRLRGRLLPLLRLLGRLHALWRAHDA
jgi:hypothetical protein